MESDIDPELLKHGSRDSFYYEPGRPLEVAAMDALQVHGLCLTLAVQGNREHLPREVLDQLEKVTCVLVTFESEISRLSLFFSLRYRAGNRSVAVAETAEAGSAGFRLLTEARL